MRKPDFLEVMIIVGALTWVIALGGVYYAATDFIADWNALEQRVEVLEEQNHAHP